MKNKLGEFKIEMEGLPANFYFLKKEKKNMQNYLNVEFVDDYNGNMPLIKKHKNNSNIIVL